MIDNLSFNFKVDDPDHILTIATKLSENGVGTNINYFTPKGKLYNQVHPMRIKLLENNMVYVSGSIHKYWNTGSHTNDNDFTWRECLLAIDKLMGELQIDLNKQDPEITALEIGFNFDLGFSVDEFLEAVAFFKNHFFRQSKPKKGSTKEWGVESIFTDYTLKFYNKAWLTNKELKSTKYNEYHLLRFEIDYFSHLKRNLDIATIGELKKSGNKIHDKLKEVLNKVEFAPSIDINTLSINEFTSLLCYLNPYFNRVAKKTSKRLKQELTKRYNLLKKKSTGRFETTRDLMINKLGTLV